MFDLPPSSQDPRTFAIIGAAYEVHRPQVLNYLASTRQRIGLLLNFGAAKLEHRRFIWEPRN